MLPFTDDRRNQSYSPLGWLQRTAHFGKSQLLLPLIFTFAFCWPGLIASPGAIAEEPQTNLILAKLQEFFRPTPIHREELPAPSEPALEIPHAAPQKAYPSGQPSKLPTRRKQVHHVFIEQPAEAPARELPAQEALPPGAFLAPPQVGSVYRERSTLGLTGLRLHLPAITLELPSLELPTITRRSRGARMDLEAAAAPYVAGLGQRPSVISTAQQAARQQPAKEASQEAAVQKEAALEKEFEKLQQRCQELESLLNQVLSHPPRSAWPHSVK